MPIDTHPPASAGRGRASAGLWRDSLVRAVATAVNVPIAGIDLVTGESWALQVEDLSVAERVDMTRANAPRIASVLRSGTAVWAPSPKTTEAPDRCDTPTLSLAAVPIVNESGAVEGCIWVAGNTERSWSDQDRWILESFGRALAQEIGRSAQVSESLHRSEQQEATHFRMLFETAPLAISIGDFEAQHFEKNPAYQELLWWWQGNPFEDTVRYTHPEDLDKDAGMFQELITGVRDHYQIEKRYIRPDGSILWGELTLALVRDPEGRPEWFYTLIQDVTERKRLEAALKRASVTDELTGLSNRRGFLSLAERECERARRLDTELLLLYLDIDGFKEINDRFGHSEGDRLLYDVADLIRRSCRSTDVQARPGAEDVFARMGGDEFVILALDAGRDAERALRERLLAAAEQYNTRSGHAYELSLSIGIVRYSPRDPGISLHTALAEADKRMYLHKRRRR